MENHWIDGKNSVSYIVGNVESQSVGYTMDTSRLVIVYCWHLNLTFAKHLYMSKKMYQNILNKAQ